MPKKIAIVEDETAIRENYIAYLSRQGYLVSGYPDRLSAQQAFALRLPDLVILDIGLKDEIDGGFELCRSLRGCSASLPIIFLTARDSDFDSVAGLRLGADDYLTKDISLPHLSARIAALFRRADLLNHPNEQTQIIEHCELCLDADRLSAIWREQPLELTVTEFWMLYSLLRHPGYVRTRDQLMDDAQILVDGPSISTHIKRIRRKFEQLDPQFDAIESVYGAGYRWRD